MVNIEYFRDLEQRANEKGLNVKAYLRTRSHLSKKGVDIITKNYAEYLKQCRNNDKINSKLINNENGQLRYIHKHNRKRREVQDHKYRNKLLSSADNANKEGKTLDKIIDVIWFVIRLLLGFSTEADKNRVMEKKEKIVDVICFVIGPLLMVLSYLFINPIGAGFGIVLIAMGCIKISEE